MAVLASSEAKEYMLGTVPFDFKNRSAALDGQRKFTEGSVWEISTPAFDHRIRPEYISCPIKSVLFLPAPTTIRRIDDPGDSEARRSAWPQTSVHVSLDLGETVKMLKMARMASASGSGKAPALTLDVCGKLLELSDQKETVDKNQKKLLQGPTLT